MINETCTRRSRASNQSSDASRETLLLFQMNVITLKLINGDEIIGREVGSTTNSITLDKVFVLRLHQTQDGSVGVGMMPWMISEDGEIEFDKRNILAGPFAPPHDMERGYLSQSSGLQL